MIQNLRKLDPDLVVIGSGGVSHGLDLAKVIALGANLGGMAYGFLEPAADSTERVVRKIRTTLQELKIAMFCAGAGSIDDLRQTPLYPASSENA